jgi:hypothetical protein
MKVETVAYKGWDSALRLSNQEVELVITTLVGPRVIRFGFIGEDNEFVEFSNQVGQTGGSEFRSYGGHRFWHAPEIFPRTYFPDNFPVKVEQLQGMVRVTPPLETSNGIQKSIDFALDDHAARVHVTHRLQNNGEWPVKLAAWALSVMNLGGVVIVPLPERKSYEGNLLPGNLMSLWLYTDMSDPRYTWGKRFIMLRHDAHAAGPQKIGLSVPDSWSAYARNGHLFVKQAAYDNKAEYPDGGCNVESYSCADFIELETLGPLTILDPGQSLEHHETWTLLRDVPQPQSEADIEKNVWPRVQAIL